MLVNSRTDQVLAQRVEDAHSFWTRFLGLMGRPGLEPESALSLRPCQSVHMFFMRFPLDVLFLDEVGNVVGLEEELRPWRLSSFYREAVEVLELPTGVIQASGTQVGDQILRVDSSSP